MSRRSVTTELLDVDVRVEGSARGPVLLLLHGWPDDASTWDLVWPGLVEAGFRVVVPTLRGFGRTRFRSQAVARTGDTAILALDAVDLLDALDVETFGVVGHDWGANMAEALAVGWPDRVRRIAMLSTPPRLGGIPTPPFWHAQRQWYHWFQATERGAAAVRADPRGFAHVMWENWSPEGWFAEADFDLVAVSFDTPDWVEVTLHSYRSRWGEAEPDERGAWLLDQVARTTSLDLPVLYVQGEADGVNPPPVSETAGQKFTGPFERVVLPGVGHFPSREAPRDLLTLLIQHFRTMLDPSLETQTSGSAT